VQAEYDKLLALCDSLEKISQERLTRGLTEAPKTLQSLRAVSHIAYYVLLGFLIAIAVLFYLVLLQPLKTKLDESHALLERQEKLASLGTLATGVAHEIRNPLTAIKFRLFSLKTTMPDSLAKSEDLDVINNEINRLDRIVKDFLQFARPSEPQFMNVPVAGIFHTIRELLLPQLQKQGIELHIQSPDAELRVRADQHQIEQVLINLVQNAADSIGQNGAITLRARSTSARLAQNLTSAVSIEVIDNGKGIPADAQRRLFDPFFSTKEGGTGLGLPIAARIAEKHGGFVQHQSQPNRGATFTLVLPKPAT
jgi:signal transduction histidine kinase